MAAISGISANLSAFLDMLASPEAEGTVLHGMANGYNVIVGGETFSNYSDHPRKLVSLPKLGIKSTAAGRYQILEKNYDFYKNELGLHDFSPVAQDAIAIRLIRECGALDEIERGEIVKAIALCKSRWASLPGAGYGQREGKLPSLLIYYKNSGGKLA